MIGEALGGWLIADFIGGLFHWWEDRVAFQRDNYIGREVIAPNRLHHAAPTAFLQADFVERNWTGWVAAAPVILLWFAVFGPSVTWAAASIGGLTSTEVHRWAHLPQRVHPIIRMLQEIGLLQSVPHHAGHHRPGRSQRYCVLTNWLNPILDELRFWPRLERLLTAAGVRLSLGAA